MKLVQVPSVRSALGIVTGLVSGFVAGLPIVLAAGDLLPIISIRSPLLNQTVSSYVTVSAMSDSPGVVGLQFKIDGQNLGSEITSGMCRAVWDSKQHTDGLHTIEAAGRDQYGNVSLAQPITVLVSNPPYPTPVPTPGPTPTPEPEPEPTPDPTPDPTPAPAPVMSISAPMSGAVLSGSAVPIAASFTSGAQLLTYSLRDRATGETRWSATGPNLSSSATSSTFTANLGTVPSGTYDLLVACRRLEGSTLTTTIPVSVAPSLTTILATTGGREFTMTASLKRNGVSASGIRVTFVVTSPLGGSRTYSATTNFLGVAVVKGRLLTSDPRGTYQVTTSAVASGVTSTASATFVN